MLLIRIAQVHLEKKTGSCKGKPGRIVQIEDNASAKCLSLLLDASGITSHPSCYLYRSLRHVLAPILRTTLREMMKQFKTEVGESAKDAKYSSLLQKKVRDRPASFSALTLIRTDSGGYVSGPQVTTTLTVKKPDRNKKEVHFAMFAVLLQVDPYGICSQQLHLLAERRLRLSGCSLKPGSSCGGPFKCHEMRARPKSNFFNAKKRLLAQERFSHQFRTSKENPFRDTWLWLFFIPIRLLIRKEAYANFGC